MRAQPESWRVHLAWYLAITLAFGAAFWVGQGPRAGLTAALGMLLFTAVVHFGRYRSDAIRVIGGAGDERNRDLYTRATAAGGSTLWLVVTVWYLVGIARGEPNPTLGILLLVFGVATIVAGVYHARTG